MLVAVVSLSLFASIIYSQKLVQIEEKFNERLSDAMGQVVEEMCKFNCNSGIYVLSPQSTKENFVIRTIEKLSFPVEIEDIHHVLELRDRRRVFTIVFVEKLEELESFFSQLNFKIFQLNGYFLVVYPNGTVNELNKIFTILWKMFVANVNIIIDSDDKKLQIFTFMPFHGNRCHNTIAVHINEFNGSQWISKNFFPRKFFNLNGCTIRVGLFNIEPAIIVNGPHLSGFDVDIISDVMTSINASLNFTIYPIATGSIFSNGSATGLLGHTIRGEVDVSLRQFSNQNDRRKLLSDTVSYHSDTLILIMPLPLPLNELLKFFRPLSFEVWISLGVVLIIALFVIRLIKAMPRLYYNLIIGEKLQNEYLNILIGFVGMSQTKVPQRNFPRFLLMMFLIFCLIIRSLYTGQMFNILKTDIRSKEFTTIHDFYKADFEFFIYETLAERLDYSEINNRRRVIKISDVEKYTMMTLNDEFRGVVFQYSAVALYINQKNFRNFTLKICKERLMTNHMVFYFQKDFYLLDEVNLKIGLIRASGINEFLVSRYADKRFKKIDTKNSGPSKLEIHHFVGAFQMWSFGLFISFFVFICEKVHVQVVNYRELKMLRRKICTVSQMNHHNNNMKKPHH